MRQTKLVTISGAKPAGLSLLPGLAVIAFATLFLLGAVAKAQDQQDDTQAGQECTEQILTGSYGYSFSGFSGPFATTTSFFLGEGRVGAVGLATFDGAGHIVVRDTLARSGTPAVRHAGIGRYGVIANCTGHASIDLASDPDPNGKIDSEHLEFDFTIVPGAHGREFSFIVTNQALTNQTLSTGDEACSDASLQGTYGLVSTGTNLVNPLKPVANANVGFRTFDGAGQITDGTDTGLQNGAIVPAGDRTGNYSVQSDCTGTATRSVAGGGNTFDLVVVAGGRQSYLLRTQNLAITNVFLKKGSGRFVMGSSDTTAHTDSSADGGRR